MEPHPTLKISHILVRVQNLLLANSSNLKVCFTSGDFTTTRQKIGVGIIPGCVFSIKPFCGN
uniref:Uncharacterized protein n=1 Tax=Anguilla anguilla TaxID=7936 RepID=A0A0E9XR12_ANGAN